jgi:FtsP/CotA-like multicopper oxidase with cupredoxin domain
MQLPQNSQSCDPSTCAGPIYKFYEDKPESNSREWHDTIPVPSGDTPDTQKVFIVMSFDAVQQLGRFVFHCHILKHEDNGLMAPIEVWGSPSLARRANQ